jgi:hypothetical protein
MLAGRAREWLDLNAAPVEPAVADNPFLAAIFNSLLVPCHLQIEWE